MKSPYDNSTLVSEITSLGIKKITGKFDIRTGCAGLAFKTKKPILEADIQNHKELSKEYPNTVRNTIALPIYNDQDNAIGALEIINSEKSTFTSKNVNVLLEKFGKYVSLLFYTNNLLRVKKKLIIEYARELRNIIINIG